MYCSRLGASLSVALIALGGCTVPPFVLIGDGPAVAPAGPKVAALMANLKCQLWDATHSDEVLPYYRDDPSLIENIHNPTPDRLFTLHNLFEEIEYVADAEFTLEVFGTGAINASVNSINPYAAMTNRTLAVAGQLSDMGHRFVNIYTSVDFSRLVASSPQASPKSLARKPSIPCNNLALGENELSGQIGLKETLATALVAETMTDVALFPSPGQPEILPISKTSLAEA